MKNLKKTVLLAMMGILMGSQFVCGQSVPKGEFLIKGKLTNVPDSAVIELCHVTAKLIKTVASDTLINGEFSFRDTITTAPRKLALMSRSEGFPGLWIELWVAQGEVTTVTGSDKLLKTWRIESDIPQQAEETRFNSIAVVEMRRYAELCAKESGLLHEMFWKNANNKEFAAATWPKINILRAEEDSLRKIMDSKELEYMKATPVTDVWIDRLRVQSAVMGYDHNSSLIPSIRELYASMSEADKKTEAGLEIGDYMTVGGFVKVGDDMVDGDLYDMQGNLHHLAEFRGSYILLDFWSIGCGPCIQSLPEMEEIAETYKDKLTVVSICGDGKDDWKTFVVEKKMKEPQWNELRRGRNTGLAGRYQAIGVPFYVVISPEGKIVNTWSGYGKGILKSKLKDIIK